MLSTPYDRTEGGAHNASAAMCVGSLTLVVRNPSCWPWSLCVVKNYFLTLAGDHIWTVDHRNMYSGL